MLLIINTKTFSQVIDYLLRLFDVYSGKNSKENEEMCVLKVRKNETENFSILQKLLFSLPEPLVQKYTK